MKPEFVDKSAKVRTALNFHMEALSDAYRPVRSIHKDYIDEIMLDFPVEFLQVVSSCTSTKVFKVLEDTMRAANSRVRRIPVTIL